MKQQNSKSQNEILTPVSWQLLTLGLLFLVTGLVFYVIARPYVVSAFFGLDPGYLFTDIGAFNGLSYWRSLPSFLHVLAFSCLSIAYLPLKRRNILVVAAVWMGVNILFELAQSFYPDNPILLVQGTYDPVDLLAAVAGAGLFIFTATLFRYGRGDELTRKKTYSMQSLVFFLGVVSITGSYQPCCGVEPYYYYPAEPVYMSYEELRSAISISKDYPLVKTGKIYIYGDYLLVNTPNQGVHIYDNSDKTKPIHRAYINIPGNLDIAVKSNFLYVDSYIDLVTLNIADLDNISVVNRLTDVFPYDPFQNIPDDVYFDFVDPEKGVVVGFIRRGLSNGAS